MPHAGQEWTFGSRTTNDESKRIQGPRPVDVFQRRFEVLVVAPKQGGEPCGVARAPEILEQEGVEQGRSLFVRDRERVRDLHADQTASHAVTGPLALGEIERI